MRNLVQYRGFQQAATAIVAALSCFPLGTPISAASESTKYPLNIENCGTTISFNKAPQRVISIGQSSTEILLSLGLAEKIVGTAVWFSPVLKEFEAENVKIKRLADNDPSFESVLAQEPDLVTAQYEWHIGPNGSVGTREQFHELKIPTYVSPADCVAKDNSGGGDGVRKEMFTMELVYREISDLAQIFDVNERGDALIAQLKKREADAVRAVAESNAKGASMVFWFSSPDVKGNAYVAGKNGPPAYIMQILGARNILTTEEEWPLASWETITGANPSVIVIAEMDRRRHGADAAAVKMNFLTTDPVVRQLQAVQKKRLVVMDAQAMNAGIRTIDGIEAVAHGISSFGLAE